MTILLVCCNPDMPEAVEDELSALPDKIDYNFHVKPILSDRCYVCHGPDENTRKANLRLDIEEEAFSKLSSGNRAFVKGSINGSEAFHRIISENPEYMMPPPDSKLELSPKEIAIISKWLDQGAEWKSHWSFLAVEKPDVPEPVEGWESTNAIDLFIQKDIYASGMSPNPLTDRERLLRRVSMDLTGLPPTIAQIDDFLKDSSPDAYENVVDRLLATDAHAERLAMEWLDVARYADSHGVSFDGYRFMWPYRDWVIDQFKTNAPFDEFITRQVAGDLIPDAGKDDILATAFYRLNPMEASMGSIEEEYRVEYVAERTAITGTAFLGLTIGCARCHDHKFDPISQKNFYQISAFFNNVEELGLGPTDANRAPTLLLFEDEAQHAYDSLERYIQTEEEKLKAALDEVSAIRKYTAGLASSKNIEGEIGYFPFDEYKKIKRKKKKRRISEEDEEEKKKKEEKKKEKIEYEEVYILDNNKNSEATLGLTLSEGLKGKAAYFDEDYDIVSLNEVQIFDHYDAFSVSAWINPEENKKGSIKTIIGNSNSYSGFFRGWDFALDSLNRLTVRLIHRLPDDFIEVKSTKAVPYDEWTQVGFAYNGNRKANGIRLFINGESISTIPITERLSRSIKPVHRYTFKPDSLALRLGKSYRLWTGDVGLFKGSIDEVRIYNRDLTTVEMSVLSGTDKKELSANDIKALNARSDPKIRSLKKTLKQSREARTTLIDTTKEIMVMKDLEEPRQAYLLERGLYNSYGAKIDPGTPDNILQYSSDLPQNRLGLAQWLTDSNNPLTSRVTINRYWQMLFGTGIVKTTEDFGNQGDLPTHPELLDWLAAEFMENNWDVRKMLKLMVMSYTYRQSSETTEQKYEADPENALYARSNRYRWSAEMIRDNALFASGLLEQKVGGESVKPYQPAGLWLELGDFSYKLNKYKQAKGMDLYRRSMYTFMRRFSPHPFLTNFDAPNREICTTRRVITNTPLQALNLLNDPQFVEASRVLSERIQKEKEVLEDQIMHGFRLSTGVTPSSNVVNTLKIQYEDALEHFNEHPAMADSLLAIGEKPCDPELDKIRTAALTMVTNTIFNYDESYMKR